MEPYYRPVLGALVGYAAAQKREYSPIGGIIAGIALGPFAVLLFFVNRTFSGRMKCPHCAEWVQREAQIWGIIYKG